jgi:hypothetical protein
LALHCGALDPARCYDEAAVKASLLEAKDGVRVSYRAIVRGERVGLSWGGAETQRVYATTAEKVRDIRRLEQEHDGVKIVSIGRALDHDVSVVDVRVMAAPEERALPTLDMEWALPPTSLRRLVESVHIVADELAQRDIVLVNLPAVFEQLGMRLAEAAAADDTPSLDVGTLALVAAIASYPALDDTSPTAAFSVNLRTRCRLDFEE